ncbi:MAG: carbamate kinase [Bacteroidales bacterium]|nr:carbamate kinase [Bacteroidales bacterium]
MAKLAMVAFGGNALLRAGQKGTYAEQLENVERTCNGLLSLLRRDVNLVIGHGNGPQVGNELLRQEGGRRAYSLEVMPMDFCGAETQGSIAYFIESAMEKVLIREGLQRRVISLVTRVEVSADDPAFRNPTKPVGPYYTEEEAKAMEGVYKPDARGLGWRKVVPSPRPLDICNIDIVERLAREGSIVITVGGGGIPVVKDKVGYKGVEAVIDKDLASALAAIRMKADEFYILTDVPKVYVNFKKPDQKTLDTLSVAKAKQFLAQGMFGEGSMAPKVRAGIMFVEACGGQCIITEAGELRNPQAGTRIIP